MTDTFASLSKTLSDPADTHFEIVADTESDVDPRPRAVFCQAPGTITISDADGTALPYTLAAGQILPFRGTRITAISGATFYAWL